MTTAYGSTSQAFTENAPEGVHVRTDARYEWITRLMEREGPAVLRLLWRLLRRESDVMDAYQDCFCKLAARGSSGDVRHARAYLFRTAANIAIEMIRVRRRHAAHWPALASARLSSGTAPDAGDDTEPTHERLRAAIAQLPAHLRNVVILRDLSRLSYEQVGRTLGIEPTTARVYRRHAIVRLADLLRTES